MTRRSISPSLCAKKAPGAPLQGPSCVVGIVTEHQLVQAIYRPEIKDQRVRQLMTRVVLSATEDTILSEVAGLMEKHRIRRLPVVRDGQVVGVVARRDLLRYLTENEAALRQFLDTVRWAGVA